MGYTLTPATLQEICIRTARSGNTTAAIEVAKQIGAIVVVHDGREQDRLRHLGVQAVSVERGLMAFAGTTRGYVVDLSVVGRAAQEWAADRAKAARVERERDEERARAEAAEREVRLLRRKAALAAETERAAILRFIRGRISACAGDDDNARESDATAIEAGTHLTRATAG